MDDPKVEWQEKVDGLDKVRINHREDMIVFKNLVNYSVKDV